MKTYRADEHYKVHRRGYDGRGDISHLSCLLCPEKRPFVVTRLEVRGGRSGLAAYNRMRSKIVGHIAGAHPGSATDAPGSDYPQTEVPG